MQVKVYTGASVSAVLANIKADLGPEAVILETRESNDNGKSEISITAALDREQGVPLAGGGQSGSSATPPGWQAWHEEWDTIRRHLLTLMKPEIRLEKLSPRQRLAVEFLQREGVDDLVTLALYERLLPRPGSSILAPLAELVPVRSFGFSNWPQLVQCVGGPFGAGKTTVAMRMSLLLRKTRPGLKICLLNADAERGGGRMLLKNYAELSEMEYRETGSRLETAAALADLRGQGFERIIVDLPALSQGKNMPETLAELGLDSPEHALHLVLGPNYAPEFYKTFLERSVSGPNGPRDLSLVWAKLDEGEKYGALVNVSNAARLPISAFSFGPGLRNTLAPARDAALWRLIFKRELPDAA